jgi:hypothetical protein
MKTNDSNSQPNRMAGALRGPWTSRLKLPLMVLTAAVVFTAGTARASDPIGVFAKIDKAVVEPKEGTPERIQLWGTFCLADPKDRDSYLPPQKGYLYYKLPAEKPEVAQKEWNDLKAKAGSGEVIGFSSRHGTQPKVRDAESKAENPDAYTLGFGLVKSGQRNSSYPPIKALQGEGKKTAAEGQGRK